MDSLNIRTIIDAALREEERSGSLRRVLENKLPQLRGRLVIAGDDPVASLMGFVTRYIQSVPSCLRLVTAVSKRLGFFEYAAPFLHMAEDYFMQPPEEVGNNSGLEALLDEAFLAHRLLEEVNDHHIRHLQRPLLPVDMTEANIIVHHLLGDDFAARLDQLVEFTASGLLRREHVWDQVRELSAVGGQTLMSLEHLETPAQEIRLRLAS